MTDCTHPRTYRNRRGILRCSDCRAPLDRVGGEVILHLPADPPNRAPAEPLAAYRDTIRARTLEAHPDAAHPRYAVYLAAYVEAAASAEALAANLDTFGIEGERGGVRSPALSAARLHRAQAVDLYAQLLTHIASRIGCARCIADPAWGSALAWGRPR